MYRLPLISKCCCVIDLRTGAFLIGILQLAGDLSIMVCALTFSPNKYNAEHNGDIITGIIAAIILKKCFRF